MENLQLIVGVQDCSGKLISSQPYFDYTYGERDLQMSVLLHGGALVQLLHDELGYIKIDNNTLQLKYLLSADTNDSAMRLLGNIAEAVVVKRCREDIILNRKWVQIARRGERVSKAADHYEAIGTGLNSTRLQYPSKCSPGNPQRDIVWIDRRNTESEMLQVSRTGVGGKVAGLQIKVSTAGREYILPDLLSNRYEVPIVYFGFSYDFDEIVHEVHRRNADLVIGRDLVDVRAIDPQAYEELRDYLPIVRSLIDGTKTIDDLLNSRGIRETPVLNSAILKTALEPGTGIALSKYLLAPS